MTRPCAACALARERWLDTTPTMLDTPGFTFGSGAAYDGTVAGVAGNRRARYERWRVLVREQRAAILAACLRGSHC